MLSIGRDQHVHAEDRPDAGEGGGHPGERVAAHAQERRGAERDEDEVARRRRRRWRSRRPGSGCTPARRGGATLTILRISAPIIPACSATPTPAIATSVTATTPNAAKFATNVENTNRNPSTESRLRISNVCFDDRVVGDLDDLVRYDVVRHDRTAQRIPKCLRVRPGRRRDRHLLGDADVQRREDCRQHHQARDQIQEHDRRFGTLLPDAFDHIEEAAARSGVGFVDCVVRAHASSRFTTTNLRPIHPLG